MYGDVNFLQGEANAQAARKYAFSMVQGASHWQRFGIATASRALLGIDQEGDVEDALQRVMDDARAVRSTGGDADLSTVRLLALRFLTCEHAGRLRNLSYELQDPNTPVARLLEGGKACGDLALEVQGYRAFAGAYGTGEETAVNAQRSAYLAELLMQAAEMHAIVRLKSKRGFSS